MTLSEEALKIFSNFKYDDSLQLLRCLSSTKRRSVCPGAVSVEPAPVKEKKPELPAPFALEKKNKR